MRAKPKLTEKPAKTMPADDGLIRLCISYAQDFAAAAAAYEADPTDSEFAERAANLPERRLRKTLAVLTATQAETAHGVSAKARVAMLIAADVAVVGSENIEIMFFASFAKDVRRLAGEWIAQDCERARIAANAAAKAVQS